MDKKFMILIFGTGEEVASLPEDKRAAYMDKWYAWDAELRAKNLVIDGEALQNESKVILGKDKKIENRFFASDKNVVIGGYYIIRANSLEEATQIAMGCPTFELDGNVEVREVWTTQ